MAQAQVLKLIERRGFVTLHELYKEFEGELSERAIRRALSKMIEFGEIHKTELIKENVFFCSIRTFQYVKEKKGEQICIEELKKLAHNGFKR